MLKLCSRRGFVLWSRHFESINVRVSIGLQLFYDAKLLIFYVSDKLDPHCGLVPPLLTNVTLFFFCFIPQTLLVQVKCFEEIISIGYSVYRIHGLPWFRSLSWYFLITSNYFFYGENLVDYFGVAVNRLVSYLWHIQQTEWFIHRTLRCRTPFGLWSSITVSCRSACTALASYGSCCRWSRSTTWSSSVCSLGPTWLCWSWSPKVTWSFRTFSTDWSGLLYRFRWSCATTWWRTCLGSSSGGHRSLSLALRRPGRASLEVDLRRWSLGWFFRIGFVSSNTLYVRFDTQRLQGAWYSSALRAIYSNHRNTLLPWWVIVLVFTVDYMQNKISFSFSSDRRDQFPSTLSCCIHCRWAFSAP